jgi:ribosome assembly protein RRB1
MVAKKRTSDVAELPNKTADRGQATARAAGVEDVDEMGEFEDRWEDEIEEEVVDKDMMEEEEEEEEGDGE